MNKPGVQKISSGVAGLDEVLKGGFVAGDSYLIRGGPGTGKTTLGLQFLCEGAKKDTPSLLISFSESTDKIKRAAHDKNLDLQNVYFLDLTPSSEAEGEEIDYNVFFSSEVEQSPIMESIFDHIKKIEPAKICLDGISQLKYIAVDNYQFRKQLLTLIKFIANYNSTLMLSSEASDTIKDDDLQFICDGVIELVFTGEARGVRVNKFRGSDFKEGLHTLQLKDTGVTVFPKVSSDKKMKKPTPGSLSSGVPELDELLNTGIEIGTTTVISGPTGVGKSTLAAQFAKEAAIRGEHTVIYTFEEDHNSLIRRCQNVNIPIDMMFEQETLSIEKINPLDYTPDHFANVVKHQVEDMGTSIVVLDSISGYHLSVKKTLIRGHDKEDDMLRNIHTLAEYLKSMNVTFILINEVHDITGEFKVSEHGISYIADNIIFLRYLEVEGELRKAVGVLKKRLGNFEKTLRAFDITRYGIKVGRPLNELRGILSGRPEFICEKEE